MNIFKSASLNVLSKCFCAVYPENPEKLILIG